MNKASLKEFLKWKNLRVSLAILAVLLGWHLLVDFYYQGAAVLIGIVAFFATAYAMAANRLLGNLALLAAVIGILSLTVLMKVMHPAISYLCIFYPSLCGWFLSVSSALLNPRKEKPSSKNVIKK